MTRGIEPPIRPDLIRTILIRSDLLRSHPIRSMQALIMKHQQRIQGGCQADVLALTAIPCVKTARKPAQTCIASPQ